jgi:ligand-binding sensor domain-containing protein/serine phosphatase RsbU (regulator of sigma subunit)
VNLDKNILTRAGSSFILSCLFVLSNLVVFAQKYNVLSFSTSDGLPGQIVNDVFQDKDGYFWFATQSGVSKFNGHEFIDFNPIKALVGIDAVSILQDAKGRICIGTNTGGLFIYDYTKTIVFNKKNGLRSDVIRKLYLDSKGILWILTSEGAFQLINDKIVPFKDPENIFSFGVLSMTESENGDIWFGTQGNGLVKSRKGKFSYYKAKDGLLDDYIFSLNSKGDSLLIGTTNQGVIIGFNNTFQQLQVPEISNAWISAILPTKRGLQIISSNGLVTYYGKGNYEIITESNGLGSNDLYNGYFDREQNLWLTSGNGVSCLRKEQIISLDRETGLTNEKITCLTNLSNGLIAVGTYGSGINLVDKKGKIISQINSKELENVKITCITEIADRKELWVGTEQASGIIIIDLEKNNYKIKRSIQTIDNIFIQTITRIDQDQKNNIWIGTFNAGLFRLSTKDTIQYHTKNKLPSNEVYTFMLDKSGAPWVSLYKKGLYKWNGQTFEQVYDKVNLNDPFILSIEEDANGSIYVGTKTSGLSIVKNGKITQITRKDGLLSNSIQAIDYRNNQLWVGTNRGINLLAFQKDGSYTMISFDQRSGLSNVEIQQNAILAAGNSIWVGTNTGLSIFQADQTNLSGIKPFIRLQSVKLFFNELNWKEKKGVTVDKEGIPMSIELSHSENHLTFSFSALTTSSVFYTYQLEGQDNKWSPLSDKREITYSSLNPGEYTFKVKAVDNYGIESTVLEIPVLIRSPFYQTWWFRISVILFIAILIYFFIRLRERNYRERQTILEETVQERTKEVVQKNKEILDSITYAKRIQSAMLPSDQILKKEFKDFFAFYQPKDIVAGDFYWFEKIEDKLLFAVADCTGHGVPGAMISVVCNNALNRVTREYGITQPSSILDKTRELILLEFSKYQDEVKDGMDVSLILFDPSAKTLEWSGANNPLWVLKKNSQEFLEIKGDKQPVGRHINNYPFTNHTLTLSDGDTLYLLTDGLSDQFGGPKGKKLKSAGLKEILITHSNLSMVAQETKLKEAFENWKGTQEQVDDICLVGIRI